MLNACRELGKYVAPKGHSEAIRKSVVVTFFRMLEILGCSIKVLLSNFLSEGFVNSFFDRRHSNDFDILEVPIHQYFLE